MGAHAGTGGSDRRQAADSGSAATGNSTNNSSAPTPTASINTTVVPTTLPAGLVDVVGGGFWAHVAAPDLLECCELSDDPKSDVVGLWRCWHVSMLRLVARVVYSKQPINIRHSLISTSCFAVC